MTKKYVTDLVVIGAGTSGCICAIAAARSGLKTILVEKTGMIGGVPASTLMGSFANLMVNTKFKRMIGGIIKELIERIVDMEGTPYKLSEDAILGKIGKPFTIPFQPVWYSQAILEMLEQAGVILFLNSTFISGKKKSDEENYLKFISGTQEFLVNAKVVVDATGNADVAKALGAEIRNLSNTTYGCLMRIGNVNIDKMIGYIKERRPWEENPDYETWLREAADIHEGEPIRRLEHLVDPLSYDHAPMEDLSDRKMNQKKWDYIEERYDTEHIVYTLELSLIRDFIKEATDNGDFILDKKIDSTRGVTFNGDGIAYGGWGEGIALCNVAKPYGFNTTDVEETTQATILAHKYNVMFFRFLKKYVPGFEDSYLLDMGAQTIPRAGQMIIGCDDQESYQENELYKEPIYIFGGLYGHQLGVPVLYGKIVCKNLTNVFSVGKGSSHGEKYRSQISCMSMGVAAAAAAKVICKEKCNSHTVKPISLRKQLRSMGVVLEGGK